MVFYFFFFNDTATTEIYTLSLHDALPIFGKKIERLLVFRMIPPLTSQFAGGLLELRGERRDRSEEHTSELQSPCNLVCRLLLEKKKDDSSRPLAAVNHRDRTMTARVRMRH